MNILFDLNHPAHVHLFRNVIQKLESEGHNIVIVAREKEVTTDLLKLYNFKYQTLSKAQSSLIGLAFELITRQLKLIPILIKNKIQLCISLTGASSIHISRLLGIPCIIFTDSEANTLQNNITIPFATAVYTPEKYHLDYKRKHHRYAGYHELAYLHPNRFTPNPHVLKEVGLKEGEVFFVLRFVAWKANHDVGQFGFTLEEKLQIIDHLKKYGKVFITSEKELEAELEEYRIRVSPDKLHDMLYYATMVIADSQTVTTESALLGTPVIRYNSYVGPDDCSNFIELEQDYDILYCFNDFQKAFAKIKALLETKDLNEEWQQKRERLLNKKIDVTEYMAEVITSYDRTKTASEKEVTC